MVIRVGTACRRARERGAFRVTVDDDAAAGLNPTDWGISSRPEAAARFGITVPSGGSAGCSGSRDLRL
jgi:hypothetical protein